ncbi:hypothetical protein J3998_13130, partial [Thiomicrorhabdus sp. 6S2-11]|nr:hypothetical protein [Thiomicrorhabdus marina]
KTEIDRVAETTKFNGTNVMNVDGGLSIQAGWETTGNDQISIATMNMSTTAIGDSFTYTTAQILAPTAFVAGDTYELTIGGTAAGVTAQTIGVDFGETVNGVLVNSTERAQDAMTYKINTNTSLIADGVFAEQAIDGTLTVKSSEENLVAGDITAGGNNDATLGAITLG